MGSMYTGYYSLLTSMTLRWQGIPLQGKGVMVYMKLKSYAKYIT